MGMQHKKELTDAFRKLFLKNADRQQKERFARWFGQLDLSQGEIFANEEEEQALEQKIQQRLKDHFLSRSAPVKRFWIPLSWPAVAAAVLVIITGTLWFFKAQKNNVKVSFTEIHTARGQRKTIVLSDGSKITLGNSSSLRYPNVFPDHLREVFLEGEGFFDITHDQARSFNVVAGKLNIQVLGTSFNVRHDPDDQCIDVVVATGKIRVNARSDRKNWMLTPGQLLSYNILTGKAMQRLVNPSDYTGWQKGELIFKDEPLGDICKRLEQWYNVKITVKSPSLKNRPIRLKLKNESLQTVFKMLAMVGDFKYEIKDKTVLVWQ